MAKSKQQAKPHVVIFVEGATDAVFFKALLEYYRTHSSCPITTYEVHNLKGVSKYNAKFEGKLKNDIIPKSQAAGRYIKTVCCSYDTDVFEYTEHPVVNWTAIRKIASKLGIKVFCEVRVQSMIEDWILEDLQGLCSYLNIKEMPTRLPGKDAFDKIQKLFRLKGLLYNKGYDIATFLPMLDMSKIRNKRREALKDLEDALGVRL